MIYCAWSSWTQSFAGLFGEVKPLLDQRIPEDARLIILPGGEDVNPAFYGEEDTDSHYTTIRDVVELRIFAEAMQRNLPVFGVCRGHQLINVALGGTLIQHLPKLKINHGSYHPIEWTEGRISSAINLDFVNSLHHQGYDISRCSPSLTPLALHDGVVEASIGDKVFSTQFHPEMMRGRVNDLRKFVLDWAGI